MSDHPFDQNPVPASTPAGLDSRLWEVVRSMNLPQEVLSDLHEFPDQVGDTLLDTAEYLDFVDRPDLAVGLLEAIRAHPPTREIGQYATYSLTERHRSRGRAHDADALFEELLASGPERGPAHLLAEELEERGRLEEALRCYNIASREELALSAPEAIDSVTMMTLMGRARVRELLGMPPDEHDLAARAGTRNIAEEGEADGPIDFDDDPFAQLEGLYATPQKTPHVEVVFSRGDLDRARDLGMIGPRTSEAEHYRDTERTLRITAREQPETELFVVLADADQVADFAEREDLDPTTRATAHTWAEDVASSGSSRLLPWPPERNKPCWCGSERKYKKCCGSPSSR